MKGFRYFWNNDTKKVSMWMRNQYVELSVEEAMTVSKQLFHAAYMATAVIGTGNPVRPFDPDKDLSGFERDLQAEVAQFQPDPPYPAA